MPKVIDKSKVEKVKEVVIRFSTTNEMSAKKAMRMLIRTHEEIMEGDLQEAR